MEEFAAFSSLLKRVKSSPPSLLLFSVIKHFSSLYYPRGSLKAIRRDQDGGCQGPHIFAEVRREVGSLCEPKHPEKRE